MALMSDKSRKLTPNAQKAQLLAVLEKLQEPISLSILLVKSGVEVNERTARRWLADWVGKGWVIKAGEKKGSVYRYVGTPLPAYLAELDVDIQQGLLRQIRDVWTHHSTAMEGNTLTLGDTQFLLEQGLTISGKPLKDHEEVIGHARAIDIINKLIRSKLTEQDIFALHLAVQTEKVTDIYKPNGAWKVETNGTYAFDENGKAIFIEYAAPEYVDALMSMLIAEINSAQVTQENAAIVYAKIHMGFVHIHPFWDGNGRMARLLANLPLLKAGLPPLVIPQEKRRNYIEILAKYQIEIGRLTLASGVWPNRNALHEFENFCAQSWSITRDLLLEARRLQESRSSKTSSKTSRKKS